MKFNDLWSWFKNRKRPTLPGSSVGRFWDVENIDEDGIVSSGERRGFLFYGDGLDGSLVSSDELQRFNNSWRLALRLTEHEELQVLFRKRTEFSQWVETQLSQSFLSDSPYGRRLLLDRLADQVSQMGNDEPRLLSQKIVICFWTKEPLAGAAARSRRELVKAQLTAFGFEIRSLSKREILNEINVSSQDLATSDWQEPEWPAVKIEGGNLLINDVCFRALELSQLPESSTELGMIQSLTKMPFPLDLCVRIKGRDTRPIINRLKRKRNLLNAKRSNKNAPTPEVENQITQIDGVLRNLADSSDCIVDLQMTVGLRLPKHLREFHRRALATLLRGGSQMDFCEFEEATIGTFDSYLECIPTLSGKNIRKHTVLGSNAIHFLPFFRPARGDKNPVATFQTREASLYSVDPTAPHLANYNWLVSGTSGSGKSFFVNSLLAQSASLNPTTYIIDIGGSYNKLARFLGGRVLSLEADQGFELSPFFLSKQTDRKEESMRRQHIYQIFLEMARIDGHLPSIEIRDLLRRSLEPLFDGDSIPEHPIAYLVESLANTKTREAAQLTMLLNPWAQNGAFGHFLDNNKAIEIEDRMTVFDLKDLTEFEDLSRVIQLIICAGLWAKVRSSQGKKFSWIVLDEVAFTVLKAQPEFVDELVSTLRKYFAGAIIVVQDLKKITANVAGASILQNTQSKAIFQQRGDPRNYSDALSLSDRDLMAIESLDRRKGYFSDIFLIRDNEKTIIRHVPSALEYWLATTAPEDKQVFTPGLTQETGLSFQNEVIQFAAKKAALP